MSNPYSKAAKDSHHSKLKSMGKANNLVIPMMRGVGENKKGGVHESASSGQHQDQAKASGMKRGGRAYPLDNHGSGSGPGRLDKNRSGPLTPIK